MTRSRLGILLFSEVLLLAAVSGILALRHPWPGLFCLALIWLLDLPRSWPWRRGLCLLLAFALAHAYALWREPAPPPVPAWLERAAFPAPNEAGEILPPAALRLAARVQSCEYLPGNRLRVILANLRPAGAAEREEAYTGLCAWTWYQPEAAPLPGTDIEATVRIAPQRGFANPGGLDTESHWRDKAVFFRAWSGARTDFSQLTQTGGEGWEAGPAAWRQALRERFMAALPTDGAGGLTPSASILPAMIFGDRSLMTERQTDLFTRSTLAHSLSLSGQHMGFAVLAGAALAMILIRLRPGVCLSVPRPRLVMLLALPFAGAYLWLGQAPPPLSRAACMLVFWAVLLCLNKPRVLLDGLLAALAFLLLLNPLSLFEISLQLSVICVAVIGLVLPTLSALGRKVFPAPEKGGAAWKSRLGRDALSILGISLAIEVALMPLTVRAFGASGLLFPLNLIWLPVLSVVVLPLSFLGLAASALLPSLAPAALWLADQPGAALLALLHALDERGLLLAPLLPRPHWLSMAGYWLLCLFLPGALRAFFAGRAKRTAAGEREKSASAAGDSARRSLFARLGPVWPLRLGPVWPLRLGPIWPLLLGLCLLLAPPAAQIGRQRESKVALRAVDVGQGESLLIEWQGLGGDRPSGRALLDGGGFASSAFDTGQAILAPILTDEALPRLDLALNSHPDADHLGGLPFLLERFSVGRYAGNGDEARGDLAQRESAALARAGLVKERLHAGQRIDLAPGLGLECLWPPAGALESSPARKGQEKGNNLSLAFRLVWQGQTLALLCGDLEKAGLEALLEREKERGQSLKAQVLLVPHHGSSGSFLPALYDAASPRLALASAGYGNRWGFPSAPVRKALEQRGVPLLSTGDHGQIRLTWTDPHGDALVDAARPRLAPPP